MRHTPYLDSVGITFKDNVPDHAVNIIDTLLQRVNSTIDWGEHEGRKRKPCPEQPLLLTGMPLGQYHCPVCLEMQIAATPHMSPDEHYEQLTGQPWPAGYEDPA
jgi:hypothetical protein